MNTPNTNDYSVFKDALGKRIQLLRTAASLTQEALAANSGLTRTTIVDIEKGATNPTLEGLARIASALGLKVPDLFSSGVAHQSTYIMQPTSGNLYTPLVEQLTTVKNGELNIHCLLYTSLRHGPVPAGGHGVRHRQQETLRGV